MKKLLFLCATFCVLFSAQAQAQAQAQKQYNEAVERENVLNKQLDNLSKGLPADFRSGDLAAGGVPVLPLVVGGLFLFWLGKRKGRKAAR